MRWLLAFVVAAPMIGQERPPAIVQLVREPLKPGAEAAYKAIEDDTARVCAESKCPHPHLAMAPIDGPREIWWLNAFESEADRRRVDDAYAANRDLMEALERNSKRKAALTGTPENVYARYRAERSGESRWTLAGARFLVIAVTHGHEDAEAPVFEAADGRQYVLRPAARRDDARAQAAKLGGNARVFEILPYWGHPAPEWVAADPEFWSTNPAHRR